MQNKEGTIKHLREHQNYPATKADLAAACNNLSDFSDEDKKWFINNLPDKSYNSADEVIKSLNW